MRKKRNKTRLCCSVYSGYCSCIISGRFCGGGHVHDLNPSSSSSFVLALFLYKLSCQNVEIIQKHKCFILVTWGLISEFHVCSGEEEKRKRQQMSRHIKNPSWELHSLCESVTMHKKVQMWGNLNKRLFFSAKASWRLLRETLCYDLSLQPRRRNIH